MERRERILVAFFVALNLTIAYWLVDWDEVRGIWSQGAQPSQNAVVPATPLEPSSPILAP